MRQAPNGSRTPATCSHPDRPNKGLGLCRLCYAKHRYAKNPTLYQDRARRYRERQKLTNPTRIPTMKRFAHIKRAYGLSPAEFQLLLEYQDSRCGMCRKPFVFTKRGGLPHTDHCHTTDALRGLLCSECNTSLGIIEDPIKRDQAARYLADRPAARLWPGRRIAA